MYEKNLQTMRWKIPSAEIELKNVEARSSIFDSSIYATASFATRSLINKYGPRVAMILNCLCSLRLLAPLLK